MSNYILDINMDKSRVAITYIDYDNYTRFIKTSKYSETEYEYTINWVMYRCTLNNLLLAYSKDLHV